MSTSRNATLHDLGTPRPTGGGEPSPTAQLIEAVFADAPTAGMPSRPAKSTTGPTRLGVVLATAAGKTALCVGVAAASVAGVAATTDRVDLSPDEHPPAFVEEKVPDEATGPHHGGGADADTDVDDTDASADVRSEADVSEVGNEIADLATTTELEGCAKGQEVSELAAFLASLDTDRADRVDPCERSDEAGPPPGAPEMTPAGPEQAKPPVPPGRTVGAEARDGKGRG